MKSLSIALISMLVILTSCKNDDTTFCSTKATLLSTSFSCYGIGLVTENGDTLVAVSNADEGHICPLASASNNMEIGDEFYLDYTLGKPGIVCRIALPEPYDRAPKIWIDCLSTGCVNGEMCTQLYQK